MFKNGLQSYIINDDKIDIVRFYLVIFTTITSLMIVVSIFYLIGSNFFYFFKFLSETIHILASLFLSFFKNHLLVFIIFYLCFGFLFTKEYNDTSINFYHFHFHHLITFSVFFLFIFGHAVYVFKNVGYLDMYNGVELKFSLIDEGFYNYISFFFAVFNISITLFCISIFAVVTNVREVISLYKNKIIHLVLTLLYLFAFVIGYFLVIKYALINNSEEFNGPQQEMLTISPLIGVIFMFTISFPIYLKHVSMVKKAEAGYIERVKKSFKYFYSEYADNYPRFKIVPMQTGVYRDITDALDNKVLKNKNISQKVILCEFGELPKDGTRQIFFNIDGEFILKLKAKEVKQVFPHRSR